MLAAMLALVLLAGIVPFNALSSDHQTCTMSCCAGRPQHNSGSCGAAFSDEHETPVEEHAHPEGIQAPGASPEIVEAASECGTTQRSSDEPTSSSDISRPAPRLTAHALTTPCSPECAAASVNAFGQVRRPRNEAALAANNRPRPTMRAALAERISKLQILSAVIGRQSRPRAPPRFPENLPA
jgi:hypothetical protein